VEWGLRDYGDEATTVWGGDSECEHEWNQDFFCSKCGAWRGQLGLEPHPQMFIDHLVEIFREVKRVLKPSGSFWLNLGDTYYGSGKGVGGDLSKSKEVYQMPFKPKQKARSNWLQPKQLLGIPWRVAIALQDDGWILRNCVVWYRSNHMPEPVRDRLTKSYEFFFFFVKQKRYFFDLDAVRVPHKQSSIQCESYGYKATPMPGRYKVPWEKREGTEDQTFLNPKGKNPGDMWSIPTQPFHGAHFAVYPPKLIEPIVKACCPRGGVVLDPFAGSGTTLRVARKLGRRFIGIEINPEYAEMCRRRVRQEKYREEPNGVASLTEFLR